MYINYKILYGTAPLYDIGFFVFIICIPQTYTQWSPDFLVKTWNCDTKRFQYTQVTIVGKLESIMNLCKQLIFVTLCDHLKGPCLWFSRKITQQNLQCRTPREMAAHELAIEALRPVGFISSTFDKRYIVKNYTRRGLPNPKRCERKEIDQFTMMLIDQYYTYILFIYC